MAQTHTAARPVPRPPTVNTIAFMNTRLADIAREQQEADAWEPYLHSSEATA
jgi:hypothetical protein